MKTGKSKTILIVVVLIVFILFIDYLALDCRCFGQPSLPPMKNKDVPGDFGKSVV